MDAKSQVGLKHSNWKGKIMEEKLQKFLDDKFKNIEIQILTKLNETHADLTLNIRGSNLIFDRVKHIHEDLNKFKTEVKAELQEIKDLISKVK